MQNKKVQILMSTYNGEKYLSVQLDSILNQTYKELEILIRDDGSTDSTADILKDYAEKYTNVKYYIGKNSGVIESFYDLMDHADDSMSYYALSDQDDYWLPEKVERAVSKLEELGENEPTLYCGTQTLVDESLTPVPMEIKVRKVEPYFGNALVENKATGCTCVMNHRTLEMIRNRRPEYTVMHDWWIYLVASCFGKVYYDMEPYIYYRQHGGNQVGARNTYYQEFKARLKRFGTNKGKIVRQIQAFLEMYEVTGDNRKLADIVVNYKRSIRQRLYAIVTRKIYRQRKVDNIIFKVLFLLGMV